MEWSKGPHTVKVVSYSGYKAEEKPQSFQIGDRSLEILKIEKTWYQEGLERRRKAYFRVRADDNNLYQIYYDEETECWFLD
ncbi:MAG: hypothetical protein SVY10_09290 [Thermodesulfobacteriota bacterium]|nr:hypothetical protein [Thermodesulfobacteriota bacterium]